MNGYLLMLGLIAMVEASVFALVGLRIFHVIHWPWWILAVLLTLILTADILEGAIVCYLGRVVRNFW
jgi:hypothetical protein